VLSGTGRRQAQRTADRLAGESVAAVYSSPLARARQTAEPIAARHGLSVEIVDGLIEVDVGLWESRAWEEIHETDPEAYRLFMTDAAVNPYLGGENLSTVLTRVIPVFESLLARNAGRTIVVVTHNVVTRAYLSHLLRMPLRCYRSIPQDNCGISLLRWDNDQVKPVTINAVDHLA
jgi:ribonuclease H / adenosylcobalamin/alpha-ribazole phosphatase